MLVLYEHHYSLSKVATKALGDSKLCTTQPPATRTSHCLLRLTRLMITSPTAVWNCFQHCLVASKRPQRTSGWLRELIGVREILHTDTPRMERYVSEFDEVRAQHGLSCLTAPFVPFRNAPEIFLMTLHRYGGRTCLLQRLMARSMLHCIHVPWSRAALASTAGAVLTLN
jgi:hypothetical protein